MGNCYHIVCDACRVSRDLDKAWMLIGNNAHIQTRDEATEFEEMVKSETFRAALMIGFMNDHNGHTIRILHDNSREYEELREYKSDGDFWQVRNSLFEEDNTLVGKQLAVKAKQMKCKKHNWSVSELEHCTKCGAPQFPVGNTNECIMDLAKRVTVLEIKAERRRCLHKWGNTLGEFICARCGRNRNDVPGDEW